MHYNRDRLLRWAKTGGITPFNVAMLGDRPNEHCIDVRLGCLAPTLELLPTKPPTDYWQAVLKPGDCMLGLLVEHISVPEDAVGEFTIRSCWAKRWLGQVLSKDVKAGWQGHLVLELINYHRTTPIVLGYGAAIGQLSLQDMG